MLPQQGHDGMEEVPQVGGGGHHGAVPGQAIDDDAPRLQPRKPSLELREMAVDLHLLRRGVPDLERAPVDLVLEVDPDGGGVPDHPGRGLIERHHQAGFAAFGAFGEKLDAGHGLAHARDPHHQGRGADEEAAMEDLVEPIDARRDPRGDIARARRHGILIRH